MDDWTDLSPHSTETEIGSDQSLKVVLHKNTPCLNTHLTGRWIKNSTKKPTLSIGFKKFLRKTALPLRRVAHILLAVEATNLAENLPDGVAIGVTTGIAREEKHRATSFSEFVSRRQHELQPNCGPLRKRHLKLDNYFTLPWFRTLHGIVLMWM